MKSYDGFWVLPFFSLISNSHSQKAKKIFVRKMLREGLKTLNGFGLFSNFSY